MHLHGLLLTFAGSWLVRVNSAAVVGSRADLKAILTDPSNNWSANTVISFPEDSTFVNVTERWTVFDPPTYAAAVTPGTETDVVQAVRISRANSIPFLSTGGRHGYGTTLGNLQDGLAIDLSQLNAVSVDQAAGTLTIGGGTRFRDIVDPVFNAGFEIQTGSCSCPGMVGVTLGGGVGRSQGLHGLLIDALVSVRVVTADAQLLEASESSNADLFWGIRGAGANLGVITSATYKLEPLANGGSVTSVDLIIPAEMNASYFDALQSYDGNMPAELAAISLITYNQTINEPQIMASWVYVGPQEEALEVMAPVLELNPPVVLINDVPWNKIDAQTGFQLDSFTCEPNKILSIYGANLRSLSASTYVSAFKKMAAFYEEYPDARSSTVSLEMFPNQAVTSVPNDATAYPWRDTITYLLMQFGWEEAGSSTEEPANALGRELRDDFVATSGFSDLSVYVNYAHGDETIEQIYSAEKLPHLAKLKATWDPDNVFAFNNPLPTAYP